MDKALGLIETVGFATAVTALDAASKAADVNLIGVEKVIGVDKAVSVTIQFAGEVAAVQAAVDAGVEAGNRVGKIVSGHVIPRPHDEVDKLIEQFSKNLNEKKQKEEQKANGTKEKNKK
ncbi:BMC domain-containing protein [Sporanaerobacter acetigenes]|uniref:BMC domain-containing protein n=1 Tax=Sporanaerobacter acetigenes TaxID=165813 RepID=UPI001045E067|nr:BMC domain-containing protein [Sporanaerobacter acetigenes]